MPRPTQIPPRRTLTAAEVAQATYVGSGEHKLVAWWGGRPLAKANKDGTVRRPKKQHTTPCPRVTEAEREEASDWVRTALREGQFRFYEGDKTYPKHIWYRDGAGSYWFGFAINQIAGTYKGWPIDEKDKREKFD